MTPAHNSKTFIVAGLVRDAVPRGYRAQFMTMANLIGIFRMKDLLSFVMSAYNNILKCNLFGVDDIILMPMKMEEAVAFFNLIKSLHEMASVIITTNRRSACSTDPKNRILKATCTF